MLLDKLFQIGKMRKAILTCRYWTCYILSVFPQFNNRTVIIFVGLLMIGIGWYKKSKCDKKVFEYMEEHDKAVF